MRDNDRRGYTNIMAHAMGGAWTDDDTDVEFVTLHAVEKYGLNINYEQITQMWKKHINRFIFAANRRARDLMEEGLIPPATGNKLNNESNFIVNITNDFWFGDYLGPYQHFYLTKIRAAEFNKPIIRVSNNGISAVIDNNGVVLNKTQFNKTEKFKHKLLFKENHNFVNFHLIFKIYFFIIFILSIFYYFKKNA